MNKIASVTAQEFLGLRTDTPSSKCPANYSPDCSDLVFMPEEVRTRPPFHLLQTLPAEVVWRKEFLCKDGSTQILALDVNGALYSLAGGVTQIDTVTPGSSVCSVTAYGREYIAFFKNGQGSDFPRQWDGKHSSRVSQGGPGGAPTLTNISSPAVSLASLHRVANVVTATTSANHGRSVGNQIQISNVSPFQVGISTIVIANANSPNIATVTTGAAHGFSPGAVVSLINVPSTNVGGGIANTNRYGGVLTTTTVQPHNLGVGATVAIVGAAGDGSGVGTVQSILSDVSFTILQPGTDSPSGGTAGPSGSQVQLIWPTFVETAAQSQFTIASCPTAMTFTVPITYPDGTWHGGLATFNWNGTYYVASVPSLTTLTYSHAGPDSTATNGTLTPLGQIAPGMRSAVVLFLKRTGFVTGVGPRVTITSGGGGSLRADNVPIGPPDTTQRQLAFTGAEGSRYFVIPQAPQVNGQIIGTSTVINDNTTTSVLLDFADNELFNGIAIDVDGNNLFRQVALNLPRGVEWYEDRLSWIGESNTVIGLQNMGFEGGSSATSPIQPLGWTVSGTGSLVARGDYGQAWSSAGATLSQAAYQDAYGSPILTGDTQYTFRMWATGTGNAYVDFYSPSVGTLGAVQVASVNGFSSGVFSARTPLVLPADVTFRVRTDAGITIDELDLIYTDNPNRNPQARMSYVANPEAYDSLTGNIGPSDDSTELRAQVLIGESFYFVTQRAVYGVQTINGVEPSQWQPYRISDKCGAFNANAIVAGKGWAVWAGPLGVFWFTGGPPEKISKTIYPTWKAVTDVLYMYDDADAERVYIGILSPLKSVLTVDYREMESGKPKWCPWSRPVNWVSYSASGTVFVVGSQFFSLSDADGASDDVLGLIGGYNTWAFAPSMFRKTFQYMGLRISGSGVLTPFLYAKTLGTLTDTLSAGELSSLLDTIAEWDINVNGRLLYVKLGQPGVNYRLQDTTIVYQNDPNAPIAGVR